MKFHYNYFYLYSIYINKFISKDFFYISIYMSKIKIYQIVDYSNAPKNMWDSWAITSDIKTICDLLKKDDNYNERLCADQLVKCFFDIEVIGLTIERIQQVIIEIFKNKLNLDVDIKDIKYTFNDKKYNKNGEKEESYHITIPKFYCINGSLKNLYDEFLIKYNIKIDTSVYGSHFFRLPNQSGKKKEDGKYKKKYKHKIINGRIQDFIIQHVDKKHNKNITKILETLKPLEHKQKKKTYNKIEVVDENLIDLLLEGLPIHFLEDYTNWFNVGALLYNLNENYIDKFDYISSFCPNYTVGCCHTLWKSLKPNQYTIGSLKYWVKRENNEYYSTLNFNEAEENIIVDTIKINKNYLTKQANEGFDIDDDILKYCDELFHTNIKSLNIKSPYGTSKTQLIKCIINKYKPERVLWLSFRQTLSDDIYHHFKELGFEHYLNGRLDSNKLIIQIESLMKIKKFELGQFIDDIYYNNTHKYDLIMLDEIESLLRQFNSLSTFSIDSNTKDTFYYLEELIKNSNKIISLDGDLNNRSYQFIKQFGEGIYLENETTKNNKTLNIVENEQLFITDIIKTLKQNKKIVICSLSTEPIKKYIQIIENKFKDIKIVHYTGKSDNKIKKDDFKDVNTSWCKYDIIFYTPTIEAGVSFDIPNYFYKIYGIINTNSCCQQAFFQMLSRVRNPMSQTITIFNNCIFNPYKSNIKVSLMKFNEVKQSYLESRKDLQIIYKDGQSTLGLDNYYINYIYNRTEELNKNPFLWLTYFKTLGEKKGYTIKFIYDNERAIKEDYKHTKDLLLIADDIDDSTYKILLDRQQGKDTTEAENIEIMKKSLELQIGLKLNENLINKYYQNTHTIKNISYLIDIDNFKDNNDSFSDEKKIKIKLINEVLTTTQLKIFNEDEMIKADQLIEGINHLNIFNTSSQLLFNHIPKNNITSDNRGMMSYLNDILSNYNLKFMSYYNGKRVASNKYYYLGSLNNIQEILYYKKLKGIIKDTKNIITKPNKLIYESQII